MVKSQPSALVRMVLLKAEIERSAVAVMEAFALSLLDSVPASMERFFDEKNWRIDPVAPEYEHRAPMHGLEWQLPIFLETLFEESMYVGGHHAISFQQDDLQPNGFASFNAMRAAFREWEKAWSGVITIEFDDENLEEKGELTVQICAVGAPNLGDAPNYWLYARQRQAQSLGVRSLY